MKIFIKIIITIIFILIFCEYLIYFFVLLNCHWPSLSNKHLDQYIPLNQEKPLRVMLIADTHLLGTRNGHWFDKLRREWQMKRSFQTALFIHHPNIVFILGDVFDEGKWASKEDFKQYYKNYQNIFSHDSSTIVKVVAGNHDMGFHYDITEEKYKRFEDKFDRSTLDLWSKSGVHFVLINSMAFEGDGCQFCREANHKLETISEILQCISGSDLNNIANCESLLNNFNVKNNNAGLSHGEYSRPIVLQHFPMFRESDSNCQRDPDAIPESVKYKSFRPKWDCLSKDASEKIMNKLEPRLVVSGHTHFSCRTDHILHSGKSKQITIPEHNVASFSWRNLNNPSFLLLKVSVNDYEISKCYLPQENTVIMIYTISIPFIIFWFSRHIIWSLLISIFSKNQKKS